MSITDDSLLWSYAANCLLYTDDAGPAQLNIGTRTEPLMASRSEAWQELYGRLVLGSFKADPDRIEAAAQQMRAEMQQPQTDEMRETRECAIDLARRAVEMIDAVGARHDPVARQRLLAGVDHSTTVDILGPLDPGIGTNSAERLVEQLREIDEQQG